MATQRRTTGYVVACDNYGGQELWKVRVKDPSSRYHDQKLTVVGHNHEATPLVVGLDVSFLVGGFSERGQTVLKAYNVLSLVDTPENFEGELRQACSCGELTDLYFEASYDDRGAAQYYYCCVRHVERTLGHIRSDFPAIHPTDPTRQRKIKYIFVAAGRRNWERWGS